MNFKKKLYSQVILRGCASVLLTLFLWIPLAETLHAHHSTEDAKEYHLNLQVQKIVKHTGFESKCNICDYLFNTHSHQLNYVGFLAITQFANEITILVNTYCSHFESDFVQSLTNKGPPCCNSIL